MESSKKRQRTEESEKSPEEQDGSIEETSDSEQEENTNDDEEFKDSSSEFGFRFKKRYQLSKGSANYPWVVVPLSGCAVLPMKSDMRRYKFDLVVIPNTRNQEKFPSPS